MGKTGKFTGTVGSSLASLGTCTPYVRQPLAQAEAGGSKGGNDCMYSDFAHGRGVVVWQNV